MNYGNICYSLDRGQVLSKFILLFLWECKQILLPILVLLRLFPVVTFPEYLNYFVCEKLVEILFVRTLSKNLFVHSCDCHVLHVITLTGFFWLFVFFLSPQMVDQFEECFLVSFIKLAGDFILITQIRKEYERLSSQRCINPMIMFLFRKLVELSFEWCSKCSKQLLKTFFDYYLFAGNGRRGLRRRNVLRSKVVSTITMRKCADKWLIIIEYLMIICQVYLALEREVWLDGDTRILLGLAIK